jgi:hypothetical protein
VRFIATHRDPERVFEKYREKLDKKAKEYARSVHLYNGHNITVQLLIVPYQTEKASPPSPN